MDDSGKKFLVVLLVLDLVVIGIWSYWDLRVVEYNSVDGSGQINFPIREGWITEIRTDPDQTVLLKIAGPEFFHLQKPGSTDPRESIVGELSVRPIGYQEESYFLAEEVVGSSDWLVVRSESPTECQLERIQGEFLVRTYPQRWVVFQTVFVIAFVVLFLSLLVVAFVLVATN